MSKRYIGLDCSTAQYGWGVVDQVDGKFQRIASGVFDFRKRGHPEMGPKLLKLGELLVDVMETYSPDVAVVETAFQGINAQAAFRISEMRGVTLMIAEKYGVEAMNVAPASMKKVIAGHGRAKKPEIATAVTVLLGQKIDFASDDESDALALAIFGGLKEER